LNIAIDRIEGSRAILVIGNEQIEVPAAALPAGAGEGDVLVFQKADASAVLAEATRRQERLAAKSSIPDEFDL
jgi:hypothetical protein